MREAGLCMNDMLRIEPPIIVGSREIYPVVSIASWTQENGGVITGVPLALLIREEGSWYFIPLVDELLTAGIAIRRLCKGKNQ